MGVLPGAAKTSDLPPPAEARRRVNMALRDPERGDLEIPEWAYKLASEATPAEVASWVAAPRRLSGAAIVSFVLARDPAWASLTTAKSVRAEGSPGNGFSRLCVCFFLYIYQYSSFVIMSVFFFYVFQE